MSEPHPTRRILSIDDDPDIRELVARVLRSAGYDIECAADGREGLEAASARRPDLIVLDVMMPQMSGYDVCEELQVDPDLANVPVIFLTALGGEQDRARAFSLGAVGHLVKPFRPDELIAAVACHLETADRFNEIVAAESEWSEQAVVATDFVQFVEHLRTFALDPGGMDLENLRPIDLYARAGSMGLTQAEVAAHLSAFLGFPRMDVIPPDQIDLAALPSAFCRKNLVVPIRTASGPGVVVSDPFNWDLMETVRQFWSTATRPRIYIAEPRVVLQVLSGMGSQRTEPDAQREHVYRFGADADLSAETAPDEAFGIDDITSDGPVAYIANNMISAAATQRASDIHIEPKESMTAVRFRIDGDLREFVTLNHKTASMVISRLKALAGLDIAERRKPQDGSLEAAVGDRRFKLRLATTSTPEGESLIVRLLEVTAEPTPLAELGLTELQARTLEGLSKRSQGLIVVVGATGSGKTTTIYSLVSRIDGLQRSILTVEDPVEYRIPHANQQQVNDKAGVTFESLLKSAVRQDPDVLFLGEIRDPYSAKMAVDFSSTGHLTVTSLHTINATTAIFRLERLGVTRDDMAEAILAIVAQRLVKRLCPACRTVRPATDEENAKLAPFTSEALSSVAEPKGCPSCGNTGYRGREAVVEVFEFDPVVQSMIRAGTPISEIRASCRARGFHLLSDRAIERVRDHTFAFADVYDRVLAEELLDLAGESEGAGGGAAVRGRAATPAKRTKHVSAASDAKTARAAGGAAAPVRRGRAAGSGPKPKRTVDAVPAAAGLRTASRVLVVDDDPDSLALVQRALESGGHRVAVARDGASALVELGGDRFDLLVADIAMPMLDGFALLTVMTDKGFDVPVIFLTGSDTPEDEARGFALGAVDYMRKPVRTDVLLARVARVLGTTPTATE
jgi:type II secretory ATPase GspE/PulE/Tfp pilus assembly ATPase PilB-like protein/DNA-binding response OmpR family regulator